MAKISRKKRKKLAEAGAKSPVMKKEKRRTPNEEGYVSKRSQHCWNHQYQMKDNGDYVCSNCQYRTKDISTELALQEYFSSRTEYKVSEIKELMHGLRMISWYRNTRGQRIYYPAKEVKDVAGVLQHYKGRELFLDINEDGSFPKFEANGRMRNVECEKTFDIRQDDWLEQIEANWKADMIRYTYSAEFTTIDSRKEQISVCRWYSEMPEGKTYVYEIWRCQPYKFVACRLPAFIKSKTYAKQYIYRTDKSLEMVVCRDSDGKIYSLSE